VAAVDPINEGENMPRGSLKVFAVLPLAALAVAGARSVPDASSSHATKAAAVAGLSQKAAGLSQKAAGLSQKAQSSGARRARRRTISLIATSAPGTPAFVGTGTVFPVFAPDMGDRFIFNDSLAKPNGQVVGHDGGVCTVTNPDFPPPPDGDTPGEIFCEFSAQLPGGQIAVMGLGSIDCHATVRLAVTGGTGKYRRARGSATVTPVDCSPTVSVFRITLVRERRGRSR
jgi:hypothetical protein